MRRKILGKREARRYLFGLAAALLETSDSDFIYHRFDEGIDPKDAEKETEILNGEISYVCKKLRQIAREGP